jgi:hypothetical protein
MSTSIIKQENRVITVGAQKMHTVMSCSLVAYHLRFGKTCYLHLQGRNKLSKNIRYIIQGVDQDKAVSRPMGTVP